MDCGGDWSGKADRDELLIFGFAASEDAESWSEQHCPAIRHRLGMKQRAEFHAREMSEPEILLYLQAARDAGIIMGAVILRKPLPTNVEALANFNCAVAAQKFFRVFLLRYRVKRFWYDTEIEGKAAEQAFETELKHINRALHPGTSFKARCRSSHQSDMVQIADSVAYTIRRHSVGTIKSKTLRQLVAEIIADERNVILRG